MIAETMEMGKIIEGGREKGHQPRKGILMGKGKRREYGVLEDE